MAAGLWERLAPRLTDLPLFIVGSFQTAWWVPGAPLSSRLLADRSGESTIRSKLVGCNLPDLEVPGMGTDG